MFHGDLLGADFANARRLDGAKSRNRSTGSGGCPNGGQRAFRGPASGGSIPERYNRDHGAVRRSCYKSRAIPCIGRWGSRVIVGRQGPDISPAFVEVASQSPSRKFVGVATVRGDMRRSDPKTSQVRQIGRVELKATDVKGAVAIANPLPRAAAFLLCDGEKQPRGDAVPLSRCCRADDAFLLQSDGPGVHCCYFCDPPPDCCPVGPNWIGH